MNRFIETIIRHRKAVVAAFLVAALCCAACIPFVKTNYDMVEYLPESAQSTRAVEIMSTEFTQDIPNANVMVPNLTLPEALELKAAIANTPGVTGVMWLDDVADLTKPLSSADAAMVETYWHAAGEGEAAQGEGSVATGSGNGNAGVSATANADTIGENPAAQGTAGTALFQASVAEGEEATAIPALRELIDARGPGGAVSGEAADTAQMQASTVEEVLGAVVIIVPIILFLLIVSTMSWIEPALFVAAIGVSILMNMGTNIFLGQVSFMTYSVSPILQLAVSLDYAIFLLHAFAAERARTPDPERAMAQAMRKSMGTIAASAVTTLFGFAALSFMQFQIGADLGLNLVKGIIFSFVTVSVFLPALTLMMWRLIDKTAHRKFMPAFSGVNKVLSKIHVPALIFVAALIVPAFLGQSHTQFTYQNSSPDATVRTGADSLAITEEFGRNNAVAVLVPRGNVAQERALSDELLQIANVTGVVSYANTVGAAVPTDLLDETTLAQFYSNNWARIVAYVDTDVESSEAFATVKAIEDTAAAHYDEWYAAGQSANLYDMKTIVSVDNVVVTGIAIVAILLVLLLTFRSLALPLILLLAIESGIWINLSIPYFMGESINFIGYLVINTVQLGATIDYAILLTTRYLAQRKLMSARSAMHLAMAEAFPSLLVSAGILTTAGLALAATSSLSAVASLGLLLGRGAVLSLVLVTCFLPALLVFCDGFVRRTTWHAGFFVPQGSHVASAQGMSLGGNPGGQHTNGESNDSYSAAAHAGASAPAAVSSDEDADSQQSRGGSHDETRS